MLQIEAAEEAERYEKTERRREKRERERQAEADAEEEVDPEMAAMMGFSGFGSSKH